jgi:hypothetical protein
MQTVAELHWPDAVALAGEAIILPYRLARTVSCSGELDGLYMIAPFGDDREGAWNCKFRRHKSILGLEVAAVSQ